MKSCKKAKQMLEEGLLAIEEGRDLTIQEMADVVHVHEFCDLMKKVYGGQEVEEAEEVEERKVKKVNAGFCHNHCDTEVDTEMDRVIRYGTDAHMRELSDVLSDHFETLLQMNPRMYEVVLNKLKAIKA